MSFTSIEVRPFKKPGCVLAPDSRILPIPEGWALLPPGDAALSRRIKADGPSYTVIELVGRKRFSRGIWAPADRIEALRRELEVERTDPAYERKLEAGRRRRAEEQVVYEKDFREAVLDYLGFHHRYAELADRMATLITTHAVPVGSGTVARTERIPIDERAEAATIAWMRHQTTGYDNMQIPRVAGKRREVRALLARRSRALIERYQRGDDLRLETCPLAEAVRLAEKGSPQP